ncbi:MAG: class I SAM-dependent methyltransferase [Candidatus Eremiobacterota bacterium]
MDYNHIVVQWDDAHRYSPAPRHRRNIILDIIKKLDFSSCLDAGCAQPYLFEYLSHMNKELYGCDISDEVINSNSKYFTNAQFIKLDISKETYPKNKKFDLVITSEVLEHIEDWKSAIKNLTKMVDKYLLITVPSGKLHKIDKIVGHIRHYQGQELIAEIERYGFKIILRKYWGFPIHTFYKYAINIIAPETIYDNFAKKKYGFMKKAISYILYYLFYINNFFNSGAQLILLAQRCER